MWVRPVLTTTPTRWMNLIQTLPRELLAEPPAPGEWSALDCLSHLVDTERWVFPIRLKAFLSHQDFPGFDPDSQGGKPQTRDSLADLAAEFAVRRTKSLDDLSKVLPPDLALKANHAELGVVTLGEMIHEWAAHDLMHTVQAERAIMQPFIRGCGPWQTYFSDHVAKQG